jgi:nitrate/nitrite transport system substrate-binding protein
LSSHGGVQVDKLWFLLQRHNQPGKWENLNCDRGELSDLQLACIICGGSHSTLDHWEFMQTMPKDPVDMVDDLVKMGVYKENQLRAADGVNAYELRKALFLKRVGGATPSAKN